MKPAIVSRADLLRALTGVATAEQARIAAMLGFDLAPEARRQPLPRDLAQAPETVAPAGAPSIAPAAPRPTPFWRPIRLRARPLDPARPRTESVAWRNRPAEPPRFQVLAPWRELQPRLRRLLATGQESGDVDVDQVVNALSRGRHLDRLPLTERPRWPSALQIILDRSDRLIPFWDDQLILTRAIRGALGATQIWIGRVDEFIEEPRSPVGEGYAPPEPGGVVLVLGDLGSLDRDAEALAGRWRRLARRILAAGARIAALIPGPLSRCAPDLRRLWNAAPWETPGPDLLQDLASRGERADRLLGLLSSCVRIEPGLLRAVRRSLPPTLADAGTESDVWQHAAIESGHCEGASVRQDSAAPLARHLLDQEVDVRRRVLELRRCWRHALPDEIWYLEVIGLPGAARGSLPDPSDFEAACAFFAAMRDRLGVVTDQPERIDAWLEEARLHVAPGAWEVPSFAAAAGSAAQKQDRAGEIPAGVDPAWLDPSGPERLLRLWQRGRGLMLLDADSPLPEAGSLLGLLRSSNSRAQIIPEAESSAPEKPDWAHDGGRDDFGPWASFTTAGADGKAVTQRLRWIPPGRFQMGSPPGEWGRFDDEAPKHEVILAEGFWLFDTPCTQTLWQAVMGESPSRHKDGRYPVETVSYDDTQRFLERLNRLVPGLDLGLPSEAQWEYACRAGTATATYAGDLGNDESRVRGVLDAIAWYDANSGNGTQPVGQKRANAWGLYDMLGNVLEWCADHWHQTYNGAPSNGSAWIDTPAGGSAHRVIRGGSWLFGARNVRAAYRGRFVPSDRDDFLGFRCARVQASGERSAVAVSGPASRPGAERGRPQRPTAAAMALRVGDNKPQAISHGPALLIRTDREELRLESFAAPPFWATGGLGRDRFGLFADLIVPDTEVSQRLRWIPPGRFVMGSPPDEPGRYEHEGPQREVMIDDGFWLFDTPCTQALWTGAMGDNPSQFQSPTRPVENVSFDDARRFVSAINERIAGLGLSLPSEAQWEYASRAGTETATYAGAIEILGENNAPVLDAIAWYGGNSGMGFELENGVNSSEWPNKQHPHERAGTRPVGLKLPNAWGLHDMLGNVWEWCADHWHDSYTGAPSDGSAWLDLSAGGSAHRVFRGGSWRNDARYVRAAYRFHYGPSVRFDNLGFRCARAHERVGASAPEQARLQGVTRFRAASPKC